MYEVDDSLKSFIDNVVKEADETMKKSKTGGQQALMSVILNEIYELKKR